MEYKYLVGGPEQAPQGVRLGERHAGLCWGNEMVGVCEGRNAGNLMAFLSHTCDAVVKVMGCFEEYIDKFFTINARRNACWGIRFLLDHANGTDPRSTQS